MIRVLLADDQKSILRKLALYVEHASDMEVVGTAADGKATLEQVAQVHPDVALVDLEMPEMDGISLTSIIRSQFPDTKVLVLTSHNEEAYVGSALRAGAMGYLLKTTPAEELLNAVRSVYKGYFQLGPGLFESFVSDEASQPVRSATAMTASPNSQTAMAAPAAPSSAVTTSPRSPAPATPAGQNLREFDQSVMLQQPGVWSRWILWAIILFSGGAILWAYFARIESAVSATGKLEPLGTVQEVKVPVNGVVEEVYIEDGQTVKAGDLLLRLDPTVSTAQEESLTEQKQVLEDENLVFQALLEGAEASPTWPYERRSQLQTRRGELDSRAGAARLQVSQLERQLEQSKVQLDSARKTLDVNQNILGGIEPLFKEGGLSRIQYLQQQQEVQKSQAEVDRLVQEEARLEFAIAQAQQELTKTVSEYRREILDQLQENQQQLSDINSQLTQATVTQKYEEVRAPISGAIFDLKAKRPGTVVSPTEPLLKLVPNEAYVARVFITNRDIGFISTGMPTDVRIDSFPFSEFGDIKGEVASIGQDVLPPDQVRDFYAFPADIKLDDQKLRTGDGREFPLQSGMSVSVNIITRDRRVITIVTDMFARQADFVRQMR
jgi:HlyD family secretion protein